jgi:methylenetetrahydrofolate--tRNA-(uracil-5-)-methyltransferase
MRPVRNTPAHTTDRLGELICSTCGQQFARSGLRPAKAELRLLDSFIMRAADGSAVLAGRSRRRSRRFAQVMRNGSRSIPH